MDDQLKEKSLKLLADPNKLKEYTLHKPVDQFKYLLECKFRCKIDNSLYSDIVEIIQCEIDVYSVMNDIINQVIVDQNLIPAAYS